MRLLLLLLPHVHAAIYSTESGCTCLSDCSRTIDSPFVKRCTTSDSPPSSSVNRTCGVFSVLRNAYWDACNSTSGNTTAASSSLDAPLITFWGMWLTMCACAAGIVAGVYALVGLALVVQLARTYYYTAQDLHPSAPIKNQLMAGLVRSPLLWLGFVLAGGAHGLLPGASLAAVVAYMYLSMPYAINYSVAIVLGATVAAVALFFAWNRGGGAIRTKLHAAQFE